MRYTTQLELRSFWTRDGVRLDADVYFPQGVGEFPVLLMRQPYGRAIASTVVYAHPRWYAQQGYIVVIQDVRGRGTSEGEFSLFAREVADGAETIAWAASLSGSSGAVGMYGFSYQGMTQLYGAMGQHPALKTLCPAMLAADLRRDWAYEGDAFCFQNNLAWAIQLAAETAKRSGNTEAFAALFAASRQLPLEEVEIPGIPEVLRRYAPDSFYFDWLNHPHSEDPYWQALNPDLQQIDLPMLHIGGWFDPYLRGTLRLYHALKQRSSHPQHLWIGPWAHLPWGQQVGGVNFGSAAQTPIDGVQLRWFDHFLKGKDTGLLTESSVHCFDLGTKIWWESSDFPKDFPVGQTSRLPLTREDQVSRFQLHPPRPQTWKFNSNGLSALRTDAGKLYPFISEDLDAHILDIDHRFQDQDLAPDSSSAIASLVQDPWRPTPALGGHGTIPAGSFNRQSLDDRSDVLTYTSSPLSEPLQLLGPIAVQVILETPNPSFDLCAILSVVQGEGVFNFSQGYRRVMRSTEKEAIEIALQPTCRTIAVGDCLRLSLSGGCFPAYVLNPGTGGDPHTTPRWQAQVITLHIHGGELHLSVKI